MCIFSLCLFCSGEGQVDPDVLVWSLKAAASQEDQALMWCLHFAGMLVAAGRARRSLVCSSLLSNALQSRRAGCTARISAHHSPWAHLLSYSRSQTAPEASSKPKVKSCLCVPGCAVTNPLSFLPTGPEDGLLPNCLSQALAGEDSI